MQNNAYHRGNSRGTQGSGPSYGNDRDMPKKERRPVAINDDNYVDEAEKVILALQGERDKLTTSKLRNLLTITVDIYNEALNCREERLDEELRSRIEYLRVRFLYEAGREPAVRNLVESAGIVSILKGINGDKKKYILFNRYMEALVAFHRYHGGKD